MFGRKAKEPGRVAGGNEEGAALLRSLKASGVAPASKGGDDMGPIDLRAEIKKLISLASQLEQKAQLAKAAQKLDLARTFADKANQAKRRAQDMMTLHKLS